MEKHGILARQRLIQSGDLGTILLLCLKTQKKGEKINGFPRIYPRVQNGVCTSDRQKQTKTGPFNQDYRMNQQSGKKHRNRFRSLQSVPLKPDIYLV